MSSEDCWAFSDCAWLLIYISLSCFIAFVRCYEMVFHSVWYTVYGQENKPIKTNMKIEFAQIDMHKYKQSRNKRHFRLSAFSRPAMLSAFFPRNTICTVGKNIPQMAQTFQDLFSHESIVITAGVCLWRKHVVK